MATLEKNEFEEFGPYRFIGRSVYALTYFEAEVYTKDTIPEDGVESTMKYYISCK